MTHNVLLYCALFSCITVSGSVIEKESPGVRGAHLFGMSRDDKPLKLDSVWIEESEWVKRKKQHDPEEGRTEQTPLRLPLDLSAFDEINLCMKALAQNDTGTIRKLMQKYVVAHEKNVLVHSQSIQKLTEFYKNIKLLEIRKLELFVKEAYTLILKKEGMLEAFSLSPQFLTSLSLPHELASLPLPLVSEEDQEHLRAQLCTVVKSQMPIDCFTLSPSGAYAVIWGTQKKDHYFEVVSLVTGESIRQVKVSHVIEGVRFYNDEQLIVWGSDDIQLWDNLGAINSTPAWWDDITLEKKGIWDLAVSEDGHSIAFGVKNNIYLLEMGHESYKILARPQVGGKKEKGQKKKGNPALFFMNKDSILVELRPTGEHLFYDCVAAACGPIEKPSDSSVKFYYHHDTQLITISLQNEVCVWDLQSISKVQLVQKGTILDSARHYIPRGQVIAIEPDKEFGFCATHSKEFIDKKPFMTTEQMIQVVLVQRDGVPAIATKRGTFLPLPSLRPSTSACLSNNGAVFVGINSRNALQAWHYYNQTVAEFLSSKMTLEQGLCVQLFINDLRSNGASENRGAFLKRDHIRAIFEGLDATVRTLLVASFPYVRMMGIQRVSSGTLSRRSSSTTPGSPIPSRSHAEFATNSSSLSPRRDSRGHQPPVGGSPTSALSTSGRALPLDRSSSLASSSSSVEQKSSSAYPSVPGTPSAQVYESSSSSSSSATTRTLSASQKLASTGESTQQPALATEQEGAATVTQGTLSVSALYTEAVTHYDRGKYKESYALFNSLFESTKESKYKNAAAYYLGILKLTGRGCHYDPPAACSHFENFAKYSSDETIQASTYMHLGTMYYFAFGTKRSQVKALDYLKRVVDLQNAPLSSKLPALFLLYRAEKKDLKKTDTESVSQLQKEALALCAPFVLSEDGKKQQVQQVPDSYLAWLYYGRLAPKPKTVQEGQDQNVFCFENAAQSPDSAVRTEALFRLGKVYYTRFLEARRAKESGTHKVDYALIQKEKEHYEKAKDFFQKVVKESDNGWVQPMAELYLGHLMSFSNETRGKSGASQALDYYTRVLNQLYNLHAQAEAAFHMAQLYEKGAPDLAADTEKSLHFYSVAIAVADVLGKQHAKAHYFLGRYYYDRIPLKEMDLPQAFEHFKVVAGESHNGTHLEESWMRLAELAEQSGIGIKRDLPFALECYRLLTEQGKNPQYKHKAYVKLARHALLKKSFIEAEKLIIKAAELPDDQACQREAKLLFAKLQRVLAKKNDKAEATSDDDTDEDDAE